MRQRLLYFPHVIMVCVLSMLYFLPSPARAGHTFQNQTQPDQPAHGVQMGPTDLLLVPNSVSLEDKRVLAGQKTRISALVVNQDAVAQSRVRVRFSCGNTNKDIFIQLRPKQRQRIHADLAIPGPTGQKTIRVEVNPIHRELAERNYGNNIGRVNVTVREKSKISQQQSPARPHPTASGSAHPPTARADLELVARSVRVNKKNITPGQEVTVSALVRNRGADGQKRVRVRFSCGSEQKDIFIHLRSQEQRPAQANIIIPGPAGRKTIVVEVNPLHQELAESSYRNNLETLRLVLIKEQNKRTPTPVPAISASSHDDNKPQHVQQPAIISKMTPDRLQVGKEYLVKLSGMHLKGALLPDFGPGIVRTGEVKHLEKMMITRVKVSAEAGTGPRPLYLAGPDGRRRQPVRFQVLAPKKGDGVFPVKKPEFVQEQPVPPPPAAPMPAQSRPAEDKKLPPHDFSSNQVVQPDMSGPGFWSMTPSRWQQGSEYTVTIKGRDFTPDQWILFKDGLKSTTSYENSSSLTVQLKVGKKARSGLRMVEICSGPKPDSGTQPGPDSDCRRTTLSGWVVRKVEKTPMPQIACQDLEDSRITPGRIYLTAPKSGFVLYPYVGGKTFPSGQKIPDHGGSYEDQGIPRLDDQTIFGWEGLSPGLAQWYELQFSTTGKKILKTIRLSAEQLQSSPELVMELYKLVRGGTVSQAMSKPSFTSTSSNFSGAIPEGDGATAGCYAACYDPGNTGENGEPPPCLYNEKWGKQSKDYMSIEEKNACMNKKHGGEFELLWQVKAYQRKKPGPCSKQTDQEFAVELVGISEYGYLWLADTPTGTSCDRGNTELTAHSIEKDKNHGDFSWYPDETIALDGAFSLHRCPWHVNGRTTLAPMNAGGPSYLFDNAFVDWGDGHVQHLKAVMSKVDGAAGSGENLQAQHEYSILARHKYDLPGRYQARVYVLASDDLDQIDAVSVQNTYRPPPSSTDEQSLSGAGAKQSAGHALRQQSGGRIYQLYCNPVDITIVQDLAATGPLHLTDLDIISFSTDEPVSSAMEHAATAAPDNTLQPAGAKKTLQATAPPTLSQAQQSGPTVSTCDAGLWARARLRYYGQGYIRLAWEVDNIVIKTEELRLGPSTLRKDLDPDPTTWTSDAIVTDSFYHSPPLPVRNAGSHRVRVSATVIADKTGSMVNSAALQFGSAKTKAGDYMLLSQAASKKAQIMADSHVESPARDYLSQDSDKEACNLLFAVKDEGDYFVVTTLRDLTKDKDGYSGRGTLIYRLPDSAWSVKEFYQPVQFSGWQGKDALPSLGHQTTTLKPGLKKAALTMPGGRPQGIVITSGHLETGTGQEIDDLPGMRVRLSKLVGEASDHVNGILDVTIKDTTLRLAGSEEPQQWQGLSAPLTPAGDWYQAGQTLGLTRIGWSLFNIESRDVRIDLSHGRGSAGDSGYIGTSTTGREWIGIHLGEADLYPYTFDLVNDLSIKVRNWVISEGGLFGTAGGTGFDHAFGDGRIGWESMDITVEQSRLDARYQGMFVEMAWPRVRLEGGDTHLTYAPGANANVQMSFEADEPVREEYGPIAMTATVLGLEHHADWGITTDTGFEFFQRDELIGEARVDNMFFTIFSKAEFGDGQPSRNLNLNDTKNFGGADITWKTMAIRASGKKCGLKIALDGKLDLKEIAESAIVAGYATRKQGDGVLASGPDIQKFTDVTYAYPKNNPVLKATIKNLQYQGGGGTGTVAGLSGLPLYAANTMGQGIYSDAWFNPGEYPLLVGINAGLGGSGCNSNDTFHADMTTKLFGGTDFDMAFRYGQEGNNAYWLGYVHGDLPAPVPLFPPAVFMTSFTGGMAYNFPANVFKKGNGLHACPNGASGLILSGGVGLSVLQDVITTNGMMTIPFSDGMPSSYEIELDDITVLEIKTGLAGRLSFATSGSFEGGLWGTFNFAGGLLKVSASENSVLYHMGIDQWFEHIGTDTEGGRIKIDLLNLLHGSGYYMLGTDIDGFKAGVAVNAKISTCGNCTCNKKHANCAWVGGQVEADILGSYDPIKFNFDGDISVGLGGCFDLKIKTVCKSIGAGVNCWMGINPTRLGFAYILDVPLVGDVKFGLNALPGPKLILDY